MGLRERLSAIEDSAQVTDVCPAYRTVLRAGDPEDQRLVFEALSNPSVSIRALYAALREENISCGRESLQDARECMKTDKCKCDWERFIK